MSLKISDLSSTAICAILELMSTITIEDVRHLAQLSSLQLSDEETETLRADIENIINYINQLGELDTSEVEPTHQVTGLENIWRDDEINSGGVTPEQLLNLAPDQANHSVKVPKVL